MAGARGGGRFGWFKNGIVGDAGYTDTWRYFADVVDFDAGIMRTILCARSAPAAITRLSSAAQLRLLAPDGRLVLEQRGNSGLFRVPRASLGTGLYVVQVQQPGGRFSRTVAVW